MRSFHSKSAINPLGVGVRSGAIPGLFLCRVLGCVFAISEEKTWGASNDLIGGSVKSIAANGEKIIAIREARGWTQECLAEKAGYVDRTIRKAESGRSLSLQTLIDISLALRIDLSEIVAPSDYQQVVAPNRRVVEQVLEGITTRNLDIAFASLSSSAFFSICSTPSCRLYQRDFTGKSEIQEFLLGFLKRIQWKEGLSPDLWISSHEYIVVHGHCEVFVSEEKTSLVNWCVTFRFHSALITEIYLYHSNVIV